MSSSTSDLIHDSVQTALAEQGMMLTSMVAVVTYLSPEGTRCWAWSVDEAQGPEVTIGLAKVVDNIADQISRNSFDIEGSTS
jgi:hypothetical protein